MGKCSCHSTAERQQERACFQLPMLRERDADSTQHANQSLGSDLIIQFTSRRSFGKEELLLLDDLFLALHTKAGCTGVRAHAQDFLTASSRSGVARQSKTCQLPIIHRLGWTSSDNLVQGGFNKMDGDESQRC